MEEAHDAAALVVVVLLLVLAPAANASRAARLLVAELVAVRGRRQIRAAASALEVGEVADVLLVIGRVLERVVAAAELFRRRFDAALRVGDGAGVLASGLARGPAFGLAIFRPLTVTGHGGLAGLAVRRVLAAPAAVLAQLDAVGVVPLRLVRLVVTPLAILTSERYRDAYISACHGAA